jgi:dTDP-4-amino-4,6-dideoxygalactose transaminase
MAIVHDVLRRGAYIMQKDLEEFEACLAEYLGMKYAIGTADGTMSLLMILKAIGVGPGDEVIVPSHTFVASAAAVHHTGATPVLADCGEDHLIRPDSIEKCISPQTKAVMPVQLNGRTADMEAIAAVADRFHLTVVEDACQALGSKFKGRFAGTFGVAGAFSFYPSKSLGCFGDGGAIVTNDDSIAEKIYRLRDHGRSANGDVACFGFNARLDNLQAAILNFKLKSYDREIEKRRELAARYDEHLRGLGELKLPPAPGDSLDHFDIYQNYEIEADRRDELREFLLSRGVQTILQWGGRTIHQFAALGLGGALPATDAMTARFMLLPMNTALEGPDIDYICEQIISFYRCGR